MIARQATTCGGGALLLAALLFGAQPSPAQPGPIPRDFRVEASHSQVGFSIGFLGFPVRGRFDDVRGTIAYVDGDVTASSISVVMPVKSISTGSDHRDNHLRSSDFFDVANHPFITFRSTSVRRQGNAYVASGPLTIKGVTRDVSIPFREVQPPIAEPHGSTLLLFSGTLRINRKDFGIMGGSRFNDWFDDVRSATMADSVDIALDVQGWDPDYTRNTQFDRALERIARGGIDTVIAPLKARRIKDSTAFQNAEWEFSQIGRALMIRGKTSDAIAMLRFNLEMFPRSASAHDALARVLERSGKRAEALSLARRALQLDPQDTWAMELVRRLRPPT